mmetsp:Transcript_14092/g.29784  ORF Transcript_14092/g.29784 Transcript_14092/m.29784 type:complete len:427 (+) Transcript_14092:59-1339(+)
MSLSLSLSLSSKPTIPQTRIWNCTESMVSLATDINVATNDSNDIIDDADAIKRQLEELSSSSLSSSPPSSSIADPVFSFRSTAPRSLNVTCYGSSSAKTPERYLHEARLLGYILAKRGHVCINGAGSYGCMAAMNDGVHAGDGHVRGVIHEMFLADNGYLDNNGKDAIDSKDAIDIDIVDRSQTKPNQKTLLRRASSHRVFENAIVLSRHGQNQQQQQPKTNRQGTTDGNSNGDDDEKASTTGIPSDDETPKKPSPIREILVAGGDDLQERKKFLVTNTDALIVLPGGPGTWDELWEMACARHLELNALPIVCVNVDGYYEPFREMLDRAHHDKLIRLEPETIVRFADSAEEAVRFVEGPVVYAADKNVCVDAGVDEEAVAARRRKRQRQRQRQQYNGPWENLVLTFVVGTLFGIAVARSAAVRRG